MKTPNERARDELFAMYTDEHDDPCYPTTTQLLEWRKSAIQAAHDEALERAAVLCDDLSKFYYDLGLKAGAAKDEGHYRECMACFIALEELAAAIREMKVNP